MLSDLRYTLRSWVKHPGFTIVALLTLAVGIGANVAMFTVLHSVLWRPLPYPDPDRLIVLEADVRGIRNAGASSREVAELRERSRTITQLSIGVGVDAHVEIDGEVERVAAASITTGVLTALGARPALGRLLDERDEAVDGPARSIIVSHALWRQRLGADPAAVGRRILVNNSPREVVGVLPADFQVLLPASTGLDEATDVWFATGNDLGEGRGAGVIGRLSTGRTVADAQNELDVLAAHFAAERPASYVGGAPQFRVMTLREAVTAPVDASLRALGFAVAFVLLVCCINVANLMLARMAGRTRELSVRRALGAGRGRLMRQLLTESLLLSIAGGALGLLLGRWGISLLSWLQPATLPRQGQVAMDATVAMFSVGITVAAGVLLGILPAFRLTDGEGDALRGGRADSPPRASRTIQRALVVFEVAVSCVLLVAAGLMLRSFVNLMTVPLGFNPDRVVTAWMPVSYRQFPDARARWTVYGQVIDRIRSLPGVEAISAASPVPFHDLRFTRRYGRAGEGAPLAQTTLQSVRPGYLDAVGTRLLEGRDFTADDVVHRMQVVIVDARIARQLWPAGAVGQRLALASGERVTELEIIGVTEPVRVSDIREDRIPHLFVPYHVIGGDMALVIKTSIPVAELQPVLKTIAQDAGTGRAVFDVLPLREYINRATETTRFTMLILSGFAFASVLLAMIGVYGTLSYLSQQRSREFGVRVALGASGPQIVGLVAREGLRLTMMGTIIGVVSAALITRTLRSLLYGVEPLDAPTLCAVAVLLAALAIAACLKPAWSAAKADPLVALRYE
jgi:putative ABC transport system permease protein